MFVRSCYRENNHHTHVRSLGYQLERRSSFYKESPYASIRLRQRARHIEGTERMAEVSRQAEKWNLDVLAELVDRYGMVKSLEEAERKLEGVKAERLLEKAAEEEESKQG